MFKLAILNKVSFEAKKSYAEVELNTLIQYLENKVTFKDFTNAKDIFQIVANTFAIKDIDITLCWYDKDYLIHSFTIDNPNEEIHDNIIMVKRKIGKDYICNCIKETDIDTYEYIDITLTDIANILRKKTIISGIYIDADSCIRNESLLYLNNNDDVGKMLLTNNKELFYLNIINIIQQNKDNNNKIDEEIQQRINDYKTDYCFTQISIGTWIMCCFYQIHNDTKNEMLSQLLNENIYGDAYIYFKSNTEFDKESILDIDTVLFKKIYNLHTNPRKIKREHEYFFNIYREL